MQRSSWRTNQLRVLNSRRGIAGMRWHLAFRVVFVPPGHEYLHYALHRVIVCRLDRQVMELSRVSALLRWPMFSFIVLSFSNRGGCRLVSPLC